MSRTRYYQAAYFAEIIGGACLMLWVIFHFQPSRNQAALRFLSLLIPGRILGFFWRDLLRGLRLLKAKEYAESKRHSELFLAAIRRKPWMKKLIWLGSGTYSRDPQAMALSNLGAAEIGLGELDAARTHLEASMKVDNQNPLPAFNLGVLAYTLGDRQRAEFWFQEARRLGYSRGIIDRIVQSSQTRFANVDGRGRS
jgi:tetratricopeptide (TPR) repeat protein